MEEAKSLSPESAISENGMESRSKRVKGKFRVSKNPLLSVFVKRIPDRQKGRVFGQLLKRSRGGAICRNCNTCENSLNA
jgi:hypothetical protein